MRTAASILFCLLFSSQIFAQTGDARFDSNDRFFLVGDSFTNGGANEWSGHVQASGELGGFVDGVDIFSSGGRKLAAIRSAFQSNYNSSNNYSAIVIAGGVNDFRIDGTHVPSTLAAMQAEVQTIINGAQNNEQIIISTIAPFKGTAMRTDPERAFWTQASQDVADAFDAWITNLANNSPNISVFDIGAAIDTDNDDVIDSNVGVGGQDLLHPTSCPPGQTCGSSVIADAFINQFMGTDIQEPPLTGVISSVIVSDGTTLTTFNTSAADPTYTGTSAILQELSVGSGATATTYNTFVGATWVGDVEGVLFPVGGTAPSASVALEDLDLSTGSLDPLGTGGPITSEYHSVVGQTIDANTVFFLFNNGTPSGPVSLVDSTGAAITNAIGLGAEAELNDFNFSRTNGGDLADRDVSGFTFSVADFTFNAGSSVADVAGFRGSGATFDAQDAGIASFVTPGFLLGDVDQNTVVDFLDISPFIDVLSTGIFQIEADCNEDGEVDFLDISPFIAILSNP